MFRKVLIANRGEIAVRIIRALREMGIISVAVYSEADRDSLHTMLADEAICIGPAPASKSYLDMDRILSAAVATGAEAIHPGFGFLSENEKFARLCTEVGIKFIGPKSETIAKLGDKAEARATMQKARIPVIPGTNGSVKNVDEALKLAKKVGAIDLPNEARKKHKIAMPRLRRYSNKGCAWRWRQGNESFKE